MSPQYTVSSQQRQGGFFTFNNRRTVFITLFIVFGIGMCVYVNGTGVEGGPGGLRGLIIMFLCILSCLCLNLF